MPAKKKSWKRHLLSKAQVREALRAQAKHGFFEYGLVYVYYLLDNFFVHDRSNEYVYLIPEKRWLIRTGLHRMTGQSKETLLAWKAKHVKHYKTNGGEYV